MRPLSEKSSLEQIRARFDADVERFSNLETGQSATVDAPLVLELLAQNALALVPTPRRMLDIGCGAGNNTLKVLQGYPHIACDLLDLSAPMLERARARVSAVATQQVQTFQGDFRTLPLPGGYDLIVAAAVLHHLRGEADWEAGFRRIFDLLNPGGALLVSDLVTHRDPAVHALMWRRYGEYLEALGGPAYREKVFDYIDYEDSPRPLSFQLALLARVGFSSVEVLHKNSVFAAFYAVK
ncbi:MAG: class I SAM-dependent methyltransferase [Meiothermus sp.]|nr:class I SAM-dependent methyltransferase [Meiothermus sp.]